MTKPIIGVVVDGEATFHLSGVNGGPDYDTLCGIDADDPIVGHNGFCPVPDGQKVTCKTCWAIWVDVVTMGVSESDFEI